MQNIIQLHNMFARISSRLSGEERNAFRQNWNMTQFNWDSISDHEITNIKNSFNRMLREVSKC